VLEGDAALHVVREAEKKPGTLVPMSTHGRSGISRWVLGSVMDRVLHATANPLLVVRFYGDGTGSLDVRLRTVTVPLGGSPTAAQVILHVVDLAKALGLNVKLARVVSTSQLFGEYVTFQYEDFSRYLADEATNYMRQISSRLRRQGVSSVEERLLHSHTDSAIVDFANETQAIWWP
jgi:nucleotide-binding universal stress UspA family protein